MVRLPPPLHRKVFISARREGKSLNRWIAEKLDKVGWPYIQFQPGKGTVFIRSECIETNMHLPWAMVLGYVAGVWCDQSKTESI